MERRTDQFDEAEAVTWTASFAVMQMMIVERMFPPHKLVPRKIAKVREAIVDMLKGYGKPIDPKFVDYVCDCWNRTMDLIQREEGKTQAMQDAEVEARLKEIESYFETHGRLIKNDTRWLIAKVREAGRR